MYIDTEVVPAYTNVGVNYQPPSYSQAPAVAMSTVKMATTQVKTTYTAEMVAMSEVNL